MIPISGYAPLNGWRQVGTPGWAVMSAHTFDASKDGQLLHYTDGDLRATVPPEGWKGYTELYPECQPIVDALTLLPKSQRPAAISEDLSGTIITVPAAEAAPAAAQPGSSSSELEQQSTDQIRL